MKDELLFKDWIAKKEWEDPDWIIISRFTYGDDKFWTHSVLLFLDRIGDRNESVPYEIKPEIRKEILKRLFDDYYLDNDLLGDFGIPYFGTNYNLFFNDHVVDKRELRFRPLIYTYDFSENIINRRDPLEIYLSSDFVTLYKLKRIDNVFKRVDDMGNEVEVVKIETNDNGDIIMKVRTNYIKDFITSANMALVRIHSHLRYRNTEFKIEQNEYKIKDKTHFYKIWYIGKQLMLLDPGQMASQLRGIDIILPYDNPINENRIFGPKPELDIEFIVGKNDDGTNKMMNLKDASYIKQAFLQFVCFKKTIMQKFYQRTELYSVEEGSHIRGPRYFLSYNNTPEDSIMVYLGDLAKLPPRELQYFKSYNINCPKNSITEDRFRRDFLAEFTSPQDFDFQFKEKINDLNQLFKNKFGFNLFQIKKGASSNYLNQIHLPVSLDKKEFKDVILIANKALVESIPTSKLKKLLTNPKEAKNLKSLKTLQKFLAESFPIWVNPVEFLFHLNDLRNIYAAHIPGTSYQKFLENHNLLSKNTKELSKWLFSGIMEFVNTFIDKLKEIY